MVFPDPVADGNILIREALQSPNYVTGVAGWQLKRDGSAELQNVTARGDVILLNNYGEPFSLQEWLTWQNDSNRRGLEYLSTSNVDITSTAETILAEGSLNFTPGHLGNNPFNDPGLYYEFTMHIDVALTVSGASPSVLVIEFQVAPFGNGVYSTFQQQLVWEAAAAGNRVGINRTWRKDFNTNYTPTYKITARLVGGSGNTYQIKSPHTSLFVRQYGSSRNG